MARKVFNARVAAALMLALFPPLAAAKAQHPWSRTVPIDALDLTNATTGSGTERTLLLLGLLGQARPIVSVRPLSRIVAEQLWPGDSSRDSSASPRRVIGDWTLPNVAAWVNTARPRADADGAVWTGRGLTLAGTGGVVIRAPFVELAARPVGFWTENRDYAPGLATTPGVFIDPYFGPRIDLPYRFGDRPYGRLDPGESLLRLGSRMVGGGFSTGSQHWGPSQFYPLLVGVEGGGYPRVFLEGSEVPVGVGRVNVNWSVGRLEASPYSALEPGNQSRIAPVLVGAFTPKGFPGLELGAGRFFHVRWRPEEVSLSTALLPFSGLVKKSNPTGESSDLTRNFNQLASVFARIAPAGGGVEAYGEFLREDHSADRRDVLVEPDHQSAFTLGLRRAWRSTEAIRAVTIEGMNARMTHLQRVRPQSPIGIHEPMVEGHTVRGQSLASAAVPGGDGLTIAFDEVRRQQSLGVTAFLHRRAHSAEGGSIDGRHIGEYGIRVERTANRRRFVEAISVALARELNPEPRRYSLSLGAVYWNAR